MSALKQWRGLAALVTDAVDHGSRAVEKVQKDTAKRPFSVLEAVPPLALPARVVHVAHDVGVTGVHVTIRVVARFVGTAVDAALAAAEVARADGENEAREQASRN